MSTPRRKISMSSKQKPLRIAILGQNGVGKSALTVRFITRRFIGDYDPDLEKVYACSRCIDGESVTLELLDTAAQEEKCRLEDHIKWAEAFILMYSVTDRCSFGEVSRLKFLINSYSKKQRKSVSSPDSAMTSTPVVLVANQVDRIHDRMVTQEEGFQRSLELSCLSFYEISVRENIDSVFKIFEDIYLMCRKPRKCRQQLCKQLSLPAFINEEKPEETLDTTAALNRRRKAIFTVS